MIIFKELEENSNIKELISSTFDVALDLSGSWGYQKENATVIHALANNMPLNQMQHMITTIRAHLEMNITQEKENRYAGVNANEKAREVIEHDGNTYHKISYELTGIKEALYNAFIKEYKAGYENESLDLSEHFQRRKEATLIREVVHYFEVSQVK
jgi:hypothetical protein